MSLGRRGIRLDAILKRSANAQVKANVAGLAAGFAHLVVCLLIRAFVRRSSRDDLAPGMMRIA